MLNVGTHTHTHTKMQTRAGLQHLHTHAETLQLIMLAYFLRLNEYSVHFSSL